MAFTDGNKAILEHATEGEELHLFNKVRDGYIRYVDQYDCAGFEYKDGVLDQNKRPRRAIGIVPALQPDHLDDFFLEPLGQDAEADADAQGEQPLLRGAHELAERLLHPRRERKLLASDLVERYGPHGGSSSCR
jgi:hypothetical protein